MTAKALPREIEGFKALGALDVIAKPFDPFTLASTLRTIWTRHRKAAGTPGGCRLIPSAGGKCANGPNLLEGGAV